MILELEYLLYSLFIPLDMIRGNFRNRVSVTSKNFPYVYPYHINEPTIGILSSPAFLYIHPPRFK